jgi:hypothetical protein
LPAHCCHPAVAGSIIYADLRDELSTHLAPQALFTQSSPVCEPLLQAFPFPSTLGEVTLHLLSQACVFIYSSCGKWVFPPLLWSFPPTAAFTSFPTPDCWACAAAPCVLCLPKPSGCRRLAAVRGPSGFSVQHEVEMLCTVWRCGVVKVLLLLGGLACKVCLQRLSKISL